MKMKILTCAVLMALFGNNVHADESTISADEAKQRIQENRARLQE